MQDSLHKEMKKFYFYIRVVNKSYIRVVNKNYITPFSVKCATD